MRTFVLAMAIFGLFLSTDQASAADAPAVSVQLPDTIDNFHLYLFTLKKNGISYNDTGASFCAKLHYGAAILESRPKVPEGDRAAPGELEWVICGFQND